MKRLLLVISAILMTAATVTAQPRSTHSLNCGWEFSRDSLFTNTRIVDVPHDFQIEQPWVEPSPDERPDNSDAAANIKSRLSPRGFKEMGAGWYRKI